MYVYTICSINKHMIDGVEQRLIYVGSTTDFERRFTDHKSNCFNPNSREYNHKVYQLIRHHGWDAFVFEVIEVLDDTTTDRDLRFREQFYIDKYDSKSSMNTKNAIIGVDRVEYNRLLDAERYKNQREKMNAQSTEWRINNRDRHNETARKSRYKKSLWKNALTDLRGIEPSFFC